jgi:ABC-type dipeptide/oligopeptide/nickel transport system permease component
MNLSRAASVHGFERIAPSNHKVRHRSQGYITTGRVKGMPEWRVVWVHAMRNVPVPLITVIALS